MNNQKTKTFEHQVIHHTVVTLYIDLVKKCCHILDLNVSGSRTVTNAVSEEYLFRVVDEYVGAADPLKAIESYRFLLYGTDGVVSEWKDDHFLFIQEHDEALHPFFESSMITRRMDEAYKRRRFS